MALTCVTYARVSTQEQAENGRSIGDQVTKCARFAEERGLFLIRSFTDEGFSGSNRNRPGLSELIRCCQENDIDRVIVVDTDRISRNTTDHFAIKAILKKYGTAVESINQPMLDDSPEGNLLDGILAAVNAFYPQVTGRKTSDTMMEKALGGWFPGPARLGYINVHDPSQEKGQRNTIQVDPIMGPLVTEAFILYANGQHSIYSLSHEMAARGLRSINRVEVTKTSIRKMLSDVFYLGDFMYKGNRLEGKHTPLIDQETFSRCQIVLEQHNQAADRKRKHHFLLAGKVYCGICGHLCTASRQLKRGKDYYHCANHGNLQHSNEGQYFLVEDLDKKVTALFKKLELPQKFVDGVMQEARRILAETHTDLDEQRRVLRARQSTLETRRNLLESKLLDEVVTSDTYKRQSTEIDTQLQQVAKELVLLDGNRQENIEEMEQLLLLATNICQAFKEAPFPLKRRYLALFFERFEIKDKKISSIVPAKLFQAILPETKKPGLLPDLSIVRNFEGWLPG